MHLLELRTERSEIWSLQPSGKQKEMQHLSFVIVYYATKTNIR